MAWASLRYFPGPQAQAPHHKSGTAAPPNRKRLLPLGNIATPLMSVSPLQIVKALWAVELPEFESMDDVNELIGVLVNGLWNDLTRHQKRSEPFRLLRTTIEPTQAGISGYARLRREELDGFVEVSSMGRSNWTCRKRRLPRSVHWPS